MHEARGRIGVRREDRDHYFFGDPAHLFLLGEAAQDVVRVGLGGHLVLLLVDDPAVHHDHKVTPAKGEERDEHSGEGQH